MSDYDELVTAIGQVAESRSAAVLGTEPYERLVSAEVALRAELRATPEQTWAQFGWRTRVSRNRRRKAALAASSLDVPAEIA